MFILAGFLLAAPMTLGAAVDSVTDAAACHQRLCYDENIRPFLDALAETTPEPRYPLQIIQIGDSLTAGDMVSNGWRVRLQQKHGTGGRGILAAGRPYQGYITWGITASQSAGWVTNSSFGRTYALGAPPLGLSSFTQTARGIGETLGFTSDSPAQGFNLLVLCGVTGPDEGSVHVQMGSAQADWSFATSVSAAHCFSLTAPELATQALVTTTSAQKVSITSMATFRSGGVVLSNLGVVGSQLKHFALTDDTVVHNELITYHPDLIVLAFGTNEGFTARLDLQAYETGLRQQIARLRKLSRRDMPMLLVGAPDGNTRSAVLANNGSTPPYQCAAGWLTPARLGDVREVQRRVARELGLAFWDWNAAMGGACSAHSWRLRELMRGDHVHFNQAGGDVVGHLMFDDLEAAAARRAQ